MNDPTTFPAPQFSILIVEDDMALQPIWEAIVKKCEIKADLTWATNEAAAERAVWQKRSHGDFFDLIICDIFLSGSKTGIDFWRLYRDDPTQFIFSSGVSPEKFNLLFSSELGNYKFISKPLDPAVCIQTILTTFNLDRIKKRHSD